MITISHTLYLNLIYFVYASFPFGLVLLYHRKGSNKRIMSTWLTGANFMVIPYFIFFGGELFFSAWHFSWLLLIVLGVIFTVGLELSLGFIINKKIIINKSSLMGTQNMFSTLKIVVYEELLFRNILVDILQSYEINFWFIVFYTSICYSLNHYFLGKWSMLTKFLWGIVFSIIVLYTKNISIVMIIHIINNILIFIISKYRYTIERREVV